MRNKKAKRTIEPDLVYNNVLVAKFTNQIMKRGKKTIARKIIYGALDLIKEKTKKDPVEVFEDALKNAQPLIEIKAKRIGGATYQVPRPVPEERGKTLAMRWILDGTRSKKGKPMAEKLSQELIDAAANTGAAIRKKENVHKMAEANRAFAHFAW